MTGEILFIADAGSSVGGGHVMRSLTLARAAALRGARPVFLTTPPVAEVLDAFAPDLDRAAVGSVDPATIAAAASQTPCVAVVIDHYGLSRPHHLQIAQGRPTLVLDDLADRPLGADLVLDAAPGRSHLDYASWAPGAKLLLGPRFAPVRPEFADLREAALSRRGGPVVRVLVALGLTDVGAITGKVVAQLLALGGQTEIVAVVGQGAPSLAALRQRAAGEPRLTLHVETSDMARLTMEADVAIGAAGSSTWERCVLGLPSVLVVLAENQKATAADMKSHDAALVVDAQTPGLEADLDTAFQRLISDGALRTQMSEASAALCDGLGAERVVDALFDLMKGD